MDGVRYTKLDAAIFKECLLEFALYAFQCEGDHMYLKTEECTQLTEVWEVPTYLPESEL